MKTIEVPCVVGDTIYINLAETSLSKPKTQKCKVVLIGIDKKRSFLHAKVYSESKPIYAFFFNELNKHWFLTKAEAKKALKKEKL